MSTDYVIDNPGGPGLCHPTGHTPPTGGHMPGRYSLSQAKLNIRFQKNVIGTLSYTKHTQKSAQNGLKIRT